MSNGNYKRKTTNPNYDWSDQRRAEYSEKCKEAHANGTWSKKKNKRGVGRPRKIHQPEAKAVQNYPATSFSENLLETASIPKVLPGKLSSSFSEGEVVIKWSWDPGVFDAEIKVLFDQIEECLGIRPDLDVFINSAVEEKIARVKKTLHKI